MSKGDSAMSFRRLLQGSVCLALLATSSVASAGWPNEIARKLGLGYSDGYHSREGCPTERGCGPAGHAHRYDGFASRRAHSPMFADQHVPYSRSSPSSPIFSAAEYRGLGADSGEPQPTPAKPRATNVPAVPNDPSMPTRHGHSEARLPSAMFPLTPAR